MLLRRSALFPPISIKELESNPVISRTRANKELGYQPRPLAQTIVDTVNWFRSHGFLDKTNQHLA
jgi:nucleoside-diphosphate-sugar epimerase